MDNQIAFIFPGQASQYPGMGRDLATNFPEAQEVFTKVSKILGFSIEKFCFHGKAEDLQLTEITQPAILTVSIAAATVLTLRGIKPHFVAGHSLGEYSALVVAGALSLSDAVQTVRKRGKYMQEAVPVGDGAMAAILGLKIHEVNALCHDSAQGEVLTPANLNSPGQIVISGSSQAVQRATALASQWGAKRAILLPVSAPFHSPLMQPAQEKLEKDLNKIDFSDLQVPLVNNVDAIEIRYKSEIANSLLRQVCTPVRWSETIQFLVKKGVGRFVEVGPGRVLSGLVRQNDRSVKLFNVEDTESLEKIVTAMG
ncbi:MAG: ACP S-malonyltransferase [Acidobacteriia bacterium]|jgi:[acyl-carrier-protein] S-malonyltransferase|nr:ACP S-malonyltransferase [Terriglobia bacterium]